MNIFQRLSDKGYSVHNKRLLGNPAYTTQETKDKDFLQELGLVLDWFRTEHGIWVYVLPYSILFRPYAEELIDTDRFGKWEGHKYNSLQEAYSAAFDYILNNLI